MIRFEVKGKPVGQPRPRAYIRGARAGVYNPSTADEWKAAIIREAREHVAAPLNGPVTVSLSFYIPRPKAHYRTGKHAGQLRESAPTLHRQTPDIDNLAKAVLDAMSDARVWSDDALIYSLSASKWWAPDGRTGGVLVAVQ